MHVFSQPSRAASSPPLQPILMLLQFAMCTLARWLHWIHNGKSGWRHLDLCLLSFVRTSIKSRMVTCMAKSQHDHLKILVFLSSDSWFLTNHLPLCAFVHLFAVCYQIPLDSFSRWNEWAFSCRTCTIKRKKQPTIYMKGQEVKDWVLLRRFYPSKAD